MASIGMIQAYLFYIPLYLTTSKCGVLHTEMSVTNCNLYFQGLVLNKGKYT